MAPRKSRLSYRKRQSKSRRMPTACPHGSGEHGEANHPASEMRNITRQPVRDMLTNGVVHLEAAARFGRGITASEAVIDEIYERHGLDETVELIEGATILFSMANQTPDTSNQPPPTIAESAENRSSQYNDLQRSHNRAITAFTHDSESSTSGASIVEAPNLAQGTTYSNEYLTNQDHIVSHSELTSGGILQNPTPPASDPRNSHTFPTHFLRHSSQSTTEEGEGSDTISDPRTAGASRSHSPSSQSPPHSGNLRASPASDDTTRPSSDILN
ncbi:Fc.00g017870.m01.CDS01 [Cosmosporella sp. VM-42]